MHIHYLQHVAFEGLAVIEPILLSQGHTISATHLYMEQALPELENVDALIVMGGPMSVQDEFDFPWLKEEKAFIKSAIAAGKKVLGICLGAQLIAEVMGARVVRNQYKEIGWFPLRRAAELKHSRLFEVFPEQTEVFHWHGDTFELPDNAIALGCSEACGLQGFIYDERVIALQFHLEITPQSVAALIKHCADELAGEQSSQGRYIQTPLQMLEHSNGYLNINQLMVSLLNSWLLVS